MYNFANTSHEYRSIATVLDSLDAMVYVADMETHELIFCNQYGRAIWGSPDGRPCWSFLQAGQTKPCEFCTNDKLIDDHGQPTGVYVWEFQNTVNKHWYQCRDQAIRWTDGRLVRIEIATDITERKLIEEKLKAAKEKAEALARTDELTGLSNRRAFFEMAERAFKQAKRFQTPLSVVMIDIDNFKHINDNHGHAGGDKVLQVFAKLLKNSIRDIDVLGRIGGEEFALVLPETILSGAAELAERLCHDTAMLTIKKGNKDIRFTSSIGIVDCRDEDETLDNLLLNADHALYAAKANGRNRVERYG
ncbi:MAG: GGDEF domain-containing protein [Gammaproteobacteria bacterium]|nr:GGDEF domain-containing protein [Gammaproteobacteria bacterium]